MAKKRKAKQDYNEVEFIMNELRRATSKWRGRTECLNRGRYKEVDPTTKNLVWFRNCDACGEPHALKDSGLEVDHIEEIGGFKGCWNEWIKRCFCEQENLQALCVPCHTKKTTTYNASLRYVRKVKDPVELL